MINIVSVSHVTQDSGVPENGLGEKSMTVTVTVARCGSCNKLVGWEFAYDVWQSVCR